MRLLPNLTWDDLKFNRNKNVIGLKFMKCVKIQEFIIIVEVYLHEKKQQKKCKEVITVTLKIVAILEGGRDCDWEVAGEGLEGGW